MVEAPTTKTSRFSELLQAALTKGRSLVKALARKKKKTKKNSTYMTPKKTSSTKTTKMTPTNTKDN